MAGLPKGVLPMTKEERRAQKKRWYDRNRKKILAYYAQHREVRRERTRRWDLANPERKRENIRASYMRNRTEKLSQDTLLNRFRRHGLTLDQYHARVE